MPIYFSVQKDLICDIDNRDTSWRIFMELFMKDVVRGGICSPAYRQTL